MVPRVAARAVPGGNGWSESRNEAGTVSNTGATGCGSSVAPIVDTSASLPDAARDAIGAAPADGEARLMAGLSAMAGGLRGTSRVTDSCGALRQSANNWSRHRTEVHASRFRRQASRSPLRSVPA
ncbi:hypothetical protein [Cupriavidus sp. EM10]|uniref:hypothetical protein n=1 Tax=Cupriavidus sp. EM10 TaxID=2839983 RepID=UPI001C0015A1|nr:hypothetical protein [Cupriavidus sp. EM10]QWE93732.1 hypothetical protein KLP38_12420 [Cupriavidus sp. EM10]